MAILDLEHIEPDIFRQGDLVVQGIEVGDIKVERGDASRTLADFFNSIDGLTATTTEGSMVLEWENQLVIGGPWTSGRTGGIQNIIAGTFV